MEDTELKNGLSLSYKSCYSWEKPPQTAPCSALGAQGCITASDFKVLTYLYLVWTEIESWVNCQVTQNFLWGLRKDLMNLSRGSWLKFYNFLWQTKRRRCYSFQDFAPPLLFYSYAFLLKNSMGMRDFVPCYLRVFWNFISVEPLDFLPIKIFPKLCVNLPLLFLKCPYNVSKPKYFNHSFKSVLKSCLASAFIPSLLQ